MTINIYPKSLVLEEMGILKEMRIPDHLSLFLRNLYAGQEATVRTGHGTTDWFQIGLKQLWHFIKNY